MAFNKMFVMLPAMLAARKLDGNDPTTVFAVRCAYFGIQTIIVLIIFYVYIVAQKASKGKYKDSIIYIPPTSQVCFVVTTSYEMIVSFNK